MRYLIDEKKQSVNDIAKSMSSTPAHIQKIIDKKDTLQTEDINNYLSHNKMKFWEFALEAIPADHIRPKTMEKIILCRDLSQRIKKRKSI